MKRKEDFEEQNSQNKRYKSGGIFNDFYQILVLDYVLDDPLDEFMNLCDVGNLKMMEWLMSKYNLSIYGKEKLTKVFEDKMAMARDPTGFYWFVRYFEITPNYENMVDAAINNMTPMVKHILDKAYGNDMSKYIVKVYKIAESKNYECFNWVTNELNVPYDPWHEEWAKDHRDGTYKAFLSAKIMASSMKIYGATGIDICSMNRFFKSLGAMNEMKYMDEIIESIDLFSDQIKKFDVCEFPPCSFVLRLCGTVPEISPRIIKNVLAKLTNMNKLMGNIKKYDDLKKYIDRIPAQDAKEIFNIILST